MSPNVRAFLASLPRHHDNFSFLTAPTLASSWVSMPWAGMWLQSSGRKASIMLSSAQHKWAKELPDHSDLLEKQQSMLCNNDYCDAFLCPRGQTPTGPRHTLVGRLPALAAVYKLQLRWTPLTNKRSHIKSKPIMRSFPVTSWRIIFKMVDLAYQSHQQSGLDSNQSLLYPYISVWHFA